MEKTQQQQKVEDSGHSEIPVLCTEVGQSLTKAVGESHHIVTVPTVVLILAEGK